MIDVKEILGDFKGGVAVWASAGDDMALAAMVQDALDAGVHLISCAPEAVGTLWPWLEKANVKIIPRFYCAAGVRDADMSELAMRINAAFKSGADGAQVFVRAADVEKFVAQIGVIRDDLFFNKMLTVGIDINEIGPFDWGVLFNALRRVRADGVMLALPRYDGDKSDFVGRIYAAMTAWDFDGELQLYCAAAPVPTAQAVRLIAAMQPKVEERTKIFVQG